eukprot:scaffold5136_cov72-Isochrysis_galbana.AAC.2
MPPATPPAAPYPPVPCPRPAEPAAAPSASRISPTLAALAEPKRRTASAAAATAAPAPSEKSTDATGSPPVGGKSDIVAPAKSGLVSRPKSAKKSVAEASSRAWVWGVPEAANRETVRAEAVGGAPSRASRRASRAREPTGRGRVSVQFRWTSEEPLRGTSRLSR